MCEILYCSIKTFDIVTWKAVLSVIGYVLIYALSEIINSIMRVGSKYVGMCVCVLMPLSYIWRMVYLFIV